MYMRAYSCNTIYIYIYIYIYTHTYIHTHIGVYSCNKHIIYDMLSIHRYTSIICMAQAGFRSRPRCGADGDGPLACARTRSRARAARAGHRGVRRGLRQPRNGGGKAAPMGLRPRGPGRVRRLARGGAGQPLLLGQRLLLWAGITCLKLLVQYGLMLLLYGITCLIRLLEFAILFATFE